MTHIPQENWTRRSLLRHTAGLAALSTASSWSQSTKKTGPQRPLAIAQIVDNTVGQADMSKDFLIGCRAAWQEVNSQGGINGYAVEHLVTETDASEGSLREALDVVKKAPHCVALSGTVGDRAASQLVGLLKQSQFNMAHVAPWMQNSELDGDAFTFPIFASRQEQIAKAFKQLSVMGVAELAAVYASEQEFTQYRSDVERAAASLNIRLQTYKPAGDLALVGKKLTVDTARILLFLGGTPELVQFLRGIDKQARQRYVIALADVNLQTMMQMGASRITPVMATQVVPMVNASFGVVRAYRETLGRLFDEPPTPQSLAGYIAARYTAAVLRRIDGLPTRQSALLAFQQRLPIDLDGFRVSFNAQGRSGAYVTQSMVTPDGRLIG